MILINNDGVNTVKLIINLGLFFLFLLARMRKVPGLGGIDVNSVLRKALQIFTQYYIVLRIACYYMLIHKWCVYKKTYGNNILNFTGTEILDINMMGGRYFCRGGACCLTQ